MRLEVKGYLSMEAIPGIFVLVIIVLAFVLLHRSGNIRERERSARISVLAKEMLCRFIAVDERSISMDYGKFELLKKGRPPRIRNYIEFQGSERHKLFEFKYIIEEHRTVRTEFASVVELCLPETELPDFILEPEKSWHKLHDFFGYSDIDFKTHKQFSDSSRLKGKNANAVRAFFNAGPIDYLESNPGHQIEVKDNRIIIAFCGTRKTVEEYVNLLNEALELWSAIRSVSF
jgi:hypothetical protein